MFEISMNIIIEFGQIYRVIEFTDPYGPQMKFDPPSSESFGELALLRDPFEERFIKISPSGLVEAGNKLSNISLRALIWNFLR